jgi:flagellar biosynthesis/type III secretory pathway protein FliH
MTWELLGHEPLPPNFAKLNIKIEQTPNAKSNQFVQGIFVEPEGDPNKVFFDPEPPKREMTVTARTEKATLIEESTQDKVIENIGISEEDLQKIVAEAERTAYERGLTDAQSEYDAKIASLTARWGAIIEDMNEQTVQARKHLEHDMIVFCTEVVRYFLRGSVPGDEEVLTRIILEALNQVDRNTACEVLVNEVDFGIVEGSPAILAILGKYGVQVAMENNIKSGCILQTEHETFNFDILDSYDRAVRELRGEKK